MIIGPGGQMFGTAGGGNASAGTIFVVEPDGSGARVLRSFVGQTDGRVPSGPPTLGPDGRLYGVTSGGGSLIARAGIVYSIRTDGSDYQVLKRFAGAPNDGGSPNGPIVFGQDGFLYGITSGGGAFGRGCYYRIATNGTSFALLHSFAGGSSDAATPAFGLVAGSNGLNFGTSQSGGTSNLGTIFRIGTNGMPPTVLHHFTGAPDDGNQPWGGLTLVGNQWLYGVTVQGGANGSGTLFRLATDGSAYEVVHHFTDRALGITPSTAPVLVSNQWLYGTANAGGSTNGTLYRIGLDGSGYSVIRDFTWRTDDAGPEGGLVVGQDGAIFGTGGPGGAALMGALYRINPDGTGFRLLHNFSAIGTGDARGHSAGFLASEDGRFYGFTASGGPMASETLGPGILVRINSDGSGYRVLFAFDQFQQKAWQPAGIPVEDAQGYLYGSTSRGGTNDLGTLFRIRKDGTGMDILRSMDPAQGATPSDGVVWGRDGALYGTAIAGGSFAGGTLFRVQPDGSGFQILRHFGSPTGDGIQPRRLTADVGSGVFFGTTDSGGASNRGTVFGIDDSGANYIVLRSFEGSPADGAGPNSGLLLDTNGFIYGTTVSGGSSNKGTVFRIRTNGQDYAVLHHFSETPTNGANPSAGLAMGSDGRLVGTTQGGGTNFGGTIFAIRPDGGGFTILHRFRGGTVDGAQPASALARSVSGELFGMTRSKGIKDNGVVFRFDLNHSSLVASTIPEGLRLRLTGVPGRSYWLESTDSLNPPVMWNPGPSVDVDGTGFIELTNSIPSQPRFYRVRTK